MYESRSILDLRFDVQKNAQKFVEICKNQGLNVLIVSTSRDQEKQTQFYKDGTGTRYVSFHAVGAGLAFDFCKNQKGQEYSDIAFFKACGAIGKRLGFEWGGDWKSPDMPHLQWSQGGKYTSADIRAGKIPPEMPEFTGTIEEPPPPSGYKYYRDGLIFVVEIDKSNFSLRYWGKKKRTTRIKNYFDAGFFTAARVGDEEIMVPKGHMALDIDFASLSPAAQKKLFESCHLENGKLKTSGLFGEFAGKFVSTLCVFENGEVSVEKRKTIPDTAVYALSGIPVIKDGADVSYSAYVLPEGWDGTYLGSGWHSAIGIRAGRLFYFGFETSGTNLVSTSEAYNKMRGFKLDELIVVSTNAAFVLDIEGKNAAVTVGDPAIGAVGLF